MSAYKARHIKRARATQAAMQDRRAGLEDTMEYVGVIL